MVRANLDCQNVEAESDYEACVVGYFILERRRYIDGRYYTTDFGRDKRHYVQLTRKSTKSVGR